MATKRLIETMSGYMKDKLAALTAPMANAYANDVVFNKIENLAATFRHRKSTKTSSRFLPVNTKGNDKSYQNSVSLAHYRTKEISMRKGVTGLGTEVVGSVGQGDAPPILWDVGMDMPAMGEHRRAQQALGRYVATERPFRSVAT
ncbi:hypothetical protein YC2023_072485 [Brassica napus]